MCILLIVVREEMIQKESRRMEDRVERVERAEGRE